MPVLTQKPAMQAQLHDDNREVSALHPSPSGRGETDALLVSEMAHPRPLRASARPLQQFLFSQEMNAWHIYFIK